MLKGNAWCLIFMTSQYCCFYSRKDNFWKPQAENIPVAFPCLTRAIDF